MRTTRPYFLFLSLAVFFSGTGVSRSETPQSSCFCVQYTGKALPPFYIGRITPVPPGCENRSYEPRGKRTPEENGLVRCGSRSAAKKAGVEKPQGLSYKKVFALSAANDGEGLRKYLAPYYEKASAPDLRMFTGPKGGFRSMGRRDSKTWGASSIIYFQSKQGKLNCMEATGPNNADMSWFKEVLNFDIDPAAWGGVFVSGKELICKPAPLNGYRNEIRIRQYDYYFLTRQASKTPDVNSLEYGLYYIDLTADYVPQ